MFSSVCAAQNAGTENAADCSFNSWESKEIKESAIIGGDTKTVYKISSSEWSASNVFAIVSGVKKTSCSVFPEKRGEGYCARLETKIENVRVAGLLNMHVLASGTIFLGDMIEPIRSTKNPQSKRRCGIPFTYRPRAISFDYKVTVGSNRIKSTGFSSAKTLGDNDYAICTVILQKRWEDSKGNIHAKRVGTMVKLFTRTSSQWIDNHTEEIHYGNITSRPFYHSYMGLIPEDLSIYTINSKGRSVPVIETGWADADERPTHIFISFSSSYGEAYIGDISNRLWIDNVKLLY